MKIEFSKQILQKRSSITFYENLSSEGRVVQQGRTVRQAWRS